MFETMVLANLMIKPCYGYELKGMLHEFNPNNNKIYPLLKKLDGEGYVVSECQHQDGKPSRKIYTITQEGRAYFIAQLSTLTSRNVIDDDDFYLCLVFAEQLPDETVKAVIEKRKKFLEVRNSTENRGMSLKEGGDVANILKEHIQKQYALEREFLAKLEGHYGI